MAASKRVTPLSKPLPAGRVVSISSFAFIYGEMVNYYRARTTSLADLEARLDNAGYGVGLRLLELAAFKDRPGRRDITVLSALQFVSSTLWMHLFSKNADALEKHKDIANAYMIREDDPATNHFISLKGDVSRHFNPAAFIAGIIRGVMDGCGLPCTVQAVTVPADLAAVAAAGGSASLSAARDKTVFVIKIEELPPTAALAAAAGGGL